MYDLYLPITCKYTSSYLQRSCSVYTENTLCVEGKLSENGVLGCTFEHISIYYLCATALEQTVLNTKCANAHWKAI